MTKLKKLAQLIHESKRTIAFTGAGISTESGIPDFRGSGGLWQQENSIVLSNDTLERNPERFYNFGQDIFKKIRDAEPNQSHYALAELEEAGELEAVITQNIDSLHQKAGSQNVLEIHGHLRSGTCLSCEEKYDIEEIFDKIKRDDVPYCDQCSGLIKPDIVLFGDPLPEDFVQSRKAAEEADLAVVIGSSLEVAPANMLPKLAAKQAVINLQPTTLDQRAEVAINQKAGEVLPQIVDLIRDR